MEGSITLYQNILNFNINSKFLKKTENVKHKNISCNESNQEVQLLQSVEHEEFILVTSDSRHILSFTYVLGSQHPIF